MAINPKHALAVGGIAVVALGAGFGVARATGDKETAKRIATPAASKAELPSVPAAASVEITELGDVAALPARRAAVRRRSGSGKTTSGSGGATPNATASPSKPSTTPAPNTTAAPPAPTAQPVTPPQSTPQPARTPVVGGGTGGDEP
jgi:hypothetical protein